MLHLGYKSLDELETTMLEEEFQSWAAFEAEEPFGERAQWLRHATMMHLTYSCHRGKGSPPRTVADFMPEF